MAWTAGTSGAAALTDGRVPGWAPDAGTFVSLGTLALALLVFRALDDIRDLDYDREHNPGRPLASGAVAVPDVLVLIAVCTALALLLNVWRWPVLCVLAAQVGYAFLIVWVDRRFGKPAGEAVIAGLFVNLPVQLLTNTFLYAGFLYSLDLRPSWSGVAAVLVATLTFFHVEFARKTTRAPRPGEHTYVTALGVTGTAGLAVACAAGSVALLLATASPWHPVVLLTVLPLAYPVLAAVRFRGNHLDRWPYRLAAMFIMTGYAGFAVVALLQEALT